MLLCVYDVVVIVDVFKVWEVVVVVLVVCLEVKLVMLCWLDED